MDGTLADTERTAFEVIRSCCADWGFKLSDDFQAQITGKKWEVAFAELFKRLGPHRLPITPPEAAQKILDQYRQSIEVHVHPVAGASRAVKALANTWNLALVSGSRHQQVNIILNHLGLAQEFKVKVASEDYPQSKPAPDAYLKALERCNCQPQNALVFEDSEVGIQSAQSAGIAVIAVTGAHHDRQDTSGAQKQIKDFSHVDADWIQKTWSQITAG